jgi:hypothetical protein
MDGIALTSSIPSKARHCFLMTRLGNPVPTDVKKLHSDIASVCRLTNYKVIDAAKTITGRDFLLKAANSGTDLFFHK